MVKDLKEQTKNVEVTQIRDSKTTVPMEVFNNGVIVEIVPKTTNSGILLFNQANVKDNAMIDGNNFIVVAYGENTRYVNLGDNIVPRQNSFAKIITFEGIYSERKDDKGKKILRQFIIMGEYDLAGVYTS